MGDVNFQCPECDQSLVVDESGCGLQVSCPSCGMQIEIPQTADWNTRRHRTKRDLAIEWAARKRLGTQGIGRLYDAQGNFWGKGFQELSNKLFELGLIKHDGNGFYVDQSHALYIPPHEET